MKSEQPKTSHEAIDSITEQVDELIFDGKIGPPEADQSKIDNHSVVDWKQLIGRIVDEELVAEIMPLCVADNRDRLALLATAVEKGDSETIQSCAHSIKGSTANMGAKRLSELACLLEHRASQGDLSQARELFQKIRVEFERFESFVSQANWIEIAKKNSG